MAVKQTRVMVGVNQSSVHGYPHPSISCNRAFESSIEKIFSSNIPRFKLLILHVQPITVVDHRVAYYSEKYNSLEEEERHKGNQLLKYFAGKCNEIGIACETYIKRGKPETVICDEVKQMQADLLVLGCRGLGAWHRTFITNVSQHCVRNAECPVIIVKRKPSEIPDPEDIAED